MSYTPPPTFQDGMLLSAAHLNTLIKDLEYLYGLASSLSHAFVPLGLDLRNIASYLRRRHRLQYLVVEGTYNKDAADYSLEFAITIDGVTVDGRTVYTNTGATTFRRVVDLDALGSPPAALAWYLIGLWCAIGPPPYGSPPTASTFTVEQVYESETNPGVLP